MIHVYALSPALFGGAGLFVFARVVEARYPLRMTSRTLVFRVQDPDTGFGPYNGISWDGRGTMSEAHCDQSHKSPHADLRLNGITYREKCGCNSPESLLRWFDGFWKELAAAGFSVTILQADEARTGAYGQVVYNYRDGVEECDTLDINTFLGLFAPLDETTDEGATLPL